MIVKSDVGREREGSDKHENIVREEQQRTILKGEWSMRSYLTVVSCHRGRALNKYRRTAVACRNLRLEGDSLYHH